MEQVEIIANLLKIIANPNRLKILCLLGTKDYTVSELHAEINNISMAALSQHLSALKLANIISSEKKGMNVFYSLADERVTKIIMVLKKEYCND